MLHYEHLTEEDLKNEIWCDIIESDNNYMISNMGKILSKQRINERGVFIKQKILQPNLTKQGYLRISFYTKGMVLKYLVHRLVGKYFIQNIYNKPEINHIKGITIDNRFHQLEWATRSEQTLHSFRVLNAPKPKGNKGKKGSLMHNSKKVLCINNGIIYGGIAEAARNLNISASSISVVCRGIKDNRKGFIFKFI